MSSDEDVGVIQRKKASTFAMMLDSSDESDGSDAEETVAAPAPAASSAAATAADDSSKGASAKKGKAKGKGGKGKGGDDEPDDWEALLEQQIAANVASGAVSAPSGAKGGKGKKGGAAAAAAPAPAPAAAPAADGDDKDEEDKEDAGGAGKDKKKKKKKGKAGKDEAEAEAEAAAPTGKVSAVARLALERQAAARAAEEKRRAEEEEAKRKYDEEVARLEAEEKRKAELKAKKSEEKRLKKEQAIREGTYRTKKQKEEAARMLARLDAMKAAGMMIEGFEAKRAEAVRNMESGTAEDDEAQAAEDKAAKDEADAAAAAAAAPAPAKKSMAAMYGKKKPAAKAATGGAGGDSGAATPAATATPAASPAVLLAGADSWEDAADAVLAAPAPAPAAATNLLSGDDDDWEAAADKVLAVPAPAPATAAAATKGAAAPAAASATAAAAKGKVAAPAAAPAPAPAPAAVPLSSMSLEDRIDASRERREARAAAAMAARTGDRLRSPICVVLGHVDTGKTSLLDKIRRTNVQEGEAGGITQQIGATYFPMDRLRTATDKLNKDLHLEYRVPGLLIIDTPGHEQFTNLRSRGSSLCDIAVLVVDVMHGLERQTIESLELLKQRRTPFVVALNKVDRCYGWKANPNAPIRDTLSKQPDYSVQEFERRTQGVLTQLAEQGLNAKLYYENDNFRTNVSVVPTSAVSGEGVPDLLMLLIQLTQQMMSHRLMFTPTVQATILEVKAIDGLGTTVDVVLVNGELNEGQTIVVCGMNGPIVTQIRALLTPPPLREMRVKSDYVHHKTIEAAMGVKIVAADLDKAVAGTELLVLHPDDEVEDLKEEVMKDFDSIMKGFKKDTVGVYVQASTLGSLEALLEYLRHHDPPVPVANVNIGPLHRKDVVTASVMLEHRKEYATILAFDVKVTPEARAAAEDLGVRVFTADIIYHLTDQFDAYLKDTLAKKQASTMAEAVFPVVAKIIPTAIFNNKAPIVVGVDVLEGKLKVGTPLCVVLPADKVVLTGQTGPAAGGAGGPAAVRRSMNILDIGRVAGIENNHVSVQEALPGGPSVAVKIEPKEGAEGIMYGRHFTHEQLLYSHISRGSIDVLKENFRDQMSKENWKTVIKLKELLGVD